MDQLKEAFDQIQADDALRNATKEYVGKHRRQPRQSLRLAVALGCLAVILLGGMWLYFTPTAHISIDIDSSMELGINRFDLVVSASGSSEAAQVLINELDLIHRNYSDAMGQILSCNTVTSLLNEGELVDVSVIAPEGDQSSRLLSEAQTHADDQENTQCHHAEPTKVQDAHRLGLSKGQYRALQELQELDPSITAEDIQGLSMRQVRAMLEDLLQQQESPKDPTNPPPKPPADEPAGPGQHGKDEENGKGNGKGNQNGKKPGGEGGKGPKNSP